VAEAVPDSALVGRVFDGRYELLDILGSGGVGVVYRARQRELDRIVAVKVLHESLVQNADFLGRFRRETVTLSRLHHPHCVEVTDVGVYQSRPYLVLEYVPGQTVAQLVDGGRFAPARAVKIALQLLETLDYFHREHVIHRDLKSENVMLIASSGGIADFVKVLDFGMAKILEGPGADSQLSKIGILPGTPSAMAPEQIQQLPPDERIDIYATGILLYEMIVGHRPFRSRDLAALVRMQLHDTPRPPRDVLAEGSLSAVLEHVILTALEKDRDRRYPSAVEMAAALRLTSEGRASTSQPAVVLSPPPPPPPLEPAVQLVPNRRRVKPALVGAAMVLAGVAVAWPLVIGRGSPRPAPIPVAAQVPVAVPVSDAAHAATPPPPVPPWLAHRDLAVGYTSGGQIEDAFREVEAAVGDDAAAAGADPALVDAAVAGLTAERVSFVVDSFRTNARLGDGLVEAAARGATADVRHAALAALEALGQKERADVVAMRMRDVEQATACDQLRVTFKELVAAKDPRIRPFLEDLRRRGRHDRHVKCLGRALSRR
jgi:hypothetical protein